MAKPKSEDKKANLLAACTKVLVRDGLDASTASIAKEAGVAAGTLFTYFPTKVALFNELYITLKTEMIESAKSGLETDESDRNKLHTVWLGWTNWAMLDADKQKALDMLKASEVLTDQTKQFGDEAMSPIFTLIKRCSSNDTDDVALLFSGELIGSIADTTIRRMIQTPDAAEQYAEAGFKAVWKIIS